MFTLPNPFIGADSDRFESWSGNHLGISINKGLGQLTRIFYGKFEKTISGDFLRFSPEPEKKKEAAGKAASFVCVPAGTIIAGT